MLMSNASSTQIPNTATRPLSVCVYVKQAVFYELAEN